MGKLTTHVLDTARGRPGAGVKIELSQLGADGGWTVIKTSTTNSDGRTDEPLLSGDKLETGVYILTFAVGDYFRQAGGAASEPAFLDLVPIRFAISDAAAHYHVPLVATPWSYSTYRGS